MLFLAFGSIQASFVSKTSPLTFEMKLAESGTNLTQKIQFDPKKQMVMYETPDHNGREHTTFYQDSETGLQFDISHQSQVCSLKQAYIKFKMADQLAALESNLEDNDERLDVDAESTETIPLDLYVLPGPELLEEDLPDKFQNLCPQGFKIQMSRIVNGKGGKVVRDPSSTAFEIEDLLLQQKSVRTGNDLDDFDELFNFLPTSAKSRQKRQTTNRCVTATGHTFRDCYVRELTCTGGCDGANIFYDCRHASDACFYTLACSATQKNCRQITHVMHANGFACTPCCSSADCGNDLKRCEYMGRPTCPTEGCPIDSVRALVQRHLPKVDYRCSQDFDCNFVTSANYGEKHNGMMCQKMRSKNQRQVLFCCDDSNARSNLEPCP